METILAIIVIIWILLTFIIFVFGLIVENYKLTDKLFKIWIGVTIAVFICIFIVQPEQDIPWK